MLNNPAVANITMQYGSNIVGQGSEYMQKKNWARTFDQSGEAPPRDDINALDLYIPLMALVTYVLTSGVVLGTQDRFSPEQLGVIASQSLAWLTLEIALISLTLYLLNVCTSVSFLDLVAYSGYKFVSMIVVLLAFLCLSRTGYYAALLFSSLSLAFFLIRSLRLHLLSGQTEGYPTAPGKTGDGNRRRLYLLLLIALVQPLVIWWMTSGVTLPRRYPTPVE